ncbi:MAG: phospholipase LlSicTox-alphaIII2-like [Gemmatimonadetes bacterium]|nr:phospholipase LlSicTox-alphaIII2-like [Gemmatimonadota bacterium]
MSYNTHTQIAVRNDFPQAVDITLTHQYSDDPADSKTWSNVQPGAVTSPWTVGYNTGFGRTGKDYWNVKVTSGGDEWKNGTHNKQCILRDDDANSLLVFSASPRTLEMNMKSGSCSDGMTLNGYNTCTRIAVLSRFADPVTITLTHQYSDDRVYTQVWRGITDGQTTSPWWVGYNTGPLRTGLDYWNVTVTDGVSVWTNDTRDKRCYLEEKDAYTVLTFDVTVTALSLNMNSSPCADDMGLVSTSQPRPVWAISHMCNAPVYLTQSLDVGANGVECDIECTVEPGGGFAFVVHHGFAGPGYPIGKQEAKTALLVYLAAMVKAARDYPGYALQYFDCKVPDGLTADVMAAMGKDLVRWITDALYPVTDPAPIYCVVNCADVAKVAFLDFAQNAGSGYAALHVGVMVDQKGTPGEVLAAFRAAGIDARSWYSHGSNIIQASLSLTEMREAVDIREQGGFSKVAMWTVNKTSSIATLMGVQIDAILSDTDYFSDDGVKNFLDYIAGSGTIRLATRADDPFAKPIPAAQAPAARVQVGDIPIAGDVAAPA